MEKYLFVDEAIEKNDIRWLFGYIHIPLLDLCQDFEINDYHKIEKQ